MASSSSHSNTTGGFPLRTTFFRSLPLTKEKNDTLYALAKENATACLNQSFNDQWRYVPPEKDGTQIRKDTSNMAASYRLVRAATVLRCQEHELNQVIANTSTESWREFTRKCFGKYYVDTIILHAVTNPTTTSQTDNQHTHQRHGRSESELGTPKVHPSHPTHHRHLQHEGEADGSARSASGRPSGWQKNGTEYAENDVLSSATTTPTISCSFLGGESDGTIEIDGRPIRYSGGPSLDLECVNNQDDETAAIHCEQADEFVTAKWGVFDTGLTGKRDLCLVDYLSLAYIPNTDKQEQVHVWCFTSTDGDNIGCMELKDTHGVSRSKLTKLGVFWRKLSDEETEVIICGSFPSKHAQGVSSILLSSLNRLQSIVEDLRLSNQIYIHRSTWVKDKERTSCHLCMRNFHALRRKHHCRKCGEVICSDCSHVETIDLPVIGYSKLRLCKVCGIRARSTPLKRLDKSNVFDRLVRARSLSNLHALSSSPFARTSYVEMKDTDSLDGLATTPSSLRHARHHGLEGRTHSSSEYSSSAASNNNDADHDSFDELAESMRCTHGSTSGSNSVAAIHPIPPPPPRTTATPSPPEDFDDFIDARSLKTQLSAMEQTKQKAGSNSNMFDLLCELACQTLNCPIASVCIVDGEGTFVRSAAGLDGNVGLDDELALFIDKVMGSTPAIVLDANVDKQVQQVFAKRGAAPEIRFFAGCPIYSRTSKKLGYVCVADLTKRDTIGASCAFTMERLATLAVTTMERNINAKQQQQEREYAQQLKHKQQQQQHHTPPPPSRTDASRAYEVLDETLPPPMYATATSLPTAASPSHTPSSSSLSSSSASAHANSSSSGSSSGSSRGAARQGEYSAGYYEAQERMKKLLLKSYHTQQQLASGSSPTTTHAMSPSSY